MVLSFASFHLQELCQNLLPKSQSYAKFYVVMELGIKSRLRLNRRMRRLADCSVGKPNQMVVGEQENLCGGQGAITSETCVPGCGLNTTNKVEPARRTYSEYIEGFRNALAFVRAREAQKLTQADFAHKIGQPLTWVMRIENSHIDELTIDDVLTYTRGLAVDHLCHYSQALEIKRQISLAEARINQLKFAQMFCPPGDTESRDIQDAADREEERRLLASAEYNLKYQKKALSRAMTNYEYNQRFQQAMSPLVQYDTFVGEWKLAIDPYITLYLRRNKHKPDEYNTLLIGEMINGKPQFWTRDMNRWVTPELFAKIKQAVLQSVYPDSYTVRYSEVPMKSAFRSPLQIAVCISGGGRHLKNLIVGQQIKNPATNRPYYEIKHVIADREAPGIKYAIEAEIPFTIFTSTPPNAPLICKGDKLRCVDDRHCKELINGSIYTAARDSISTRSDNYTSVEIEESKNHIYSANVFEVVEPTPRSPQFNSRSLLATCEDVDYICLAGFLSYLYIPPEWKNRIINIHPSLLPLFGGKGMYKEKVHQAVLDSGVQFSGCTVHFVDEIYDHGPIILQKIAPVCSEDTVEKLANRVFEQEKLAYPEALQMLARGFKSWKDLKLYRPMFDGQTWLNQE